MVYTFPTDNRSGHPESDRIDQLTPPTGSVDMVLDTDTYNEIDDQFAIVYSVLSERINLEAIYAAPFHNEHSSGPEDGMEKSYSEIKELRGLLEESATELPAYRGCTDYMISEDGPVSSPATADLISRARRRESEKPLYVVSIGAPTNVASAIEKSPEITDSIVVVWLGGHPLSWHTAWEFNLFQDIRASRVLFNSGVSLVLVPCKNVAEHVRTTVPELRAKLDPTDDVSEYLLDTVLRYRNDRETPGAWSKEIWDVAPIAYLLEHEWVPTTIDHSPRLSEDCRYIRDPSRHLIRVAMDARRDPILTDFFEKVSDR